MRRRTCHLTVLLLALPAAAFAQATASGFDAAGVATLRIGARPGDGVNDAVRLSFGGVLLAGTVGGAAGLQAFVARLLPDGTPDPTFGTGGVATLPAPSTGLAVAAHPEGGAIVAGTVETASTLDLIVARFGHTGALVTSWGTDGVVTATLPSFGARSVGVLADGRVYVGGVSGNPSRATVVRLTAAGAFDAAYGTGGVATAGPDTALGDLVLTAGGTAYATGTAGPFSTRTLAAFCFNSGGAPCAGFAGGAGVVTAPIPGGRSSGLAIVRDTLGRLVVSGTAGGDQQAVVARFTAAGVLDGAFNLGLGYRLLGFADVSRGAGVALDATGRIVVGGLQAADLFGATPRLAAVARLTALGALDAAFGSGGLLTTGIRGNDDMLAVFVEPSGRILLAGSTGPTLAGSRAAVTLAVTDAGQPDASYGPGGAVISPLSSLTHSPASAIAALADGRLLVGGQASFSDGEHPYLARLAADGVLDPTFGDAGVRLLPVDAGTGIAGIAVDPAGRILAVVSLRQSLASNVVARFSPDGALDASFGVGGFASIPQVPNPLYARLTPLADGSLLATGYENTVSGPLLVAKFTAAGGLDPVFGPGGAATFPFDMGSDRGGDVRALADGRVLVAGLADDLPAVVRLTAGGALDPTFDGDGVATLAIAGHGSNLVSIDEAGILFGGFLPANAGILLARFDHAGAPDAGFGAGGVVTDGSVAPTRNLAGIAADAAGCLVAAGARGPSEAPVVAVARYGPDGAPDPTFGTAGGVTAAVGGGLLTFDFALDPLGRAHVTGGVRNGPDYVAVIARIPAACDDGDACTVDRCVAGAGCTQPRLAGIPGVRCLCGVLPAACASETPPRSLARKADKACAALEAAESADGKKRRRRLARAKRLFKQAAKKSSRAARGRRPKLTAECAAALAATFGEQRTRVVDVLGAS